MTAKYPDSKKFKQGLNEKSLKQFYLFLGEEEGEKDKVIKHLLDIILKDETDRVSCTGRFHMDTDDLNEAVGFALSSSMFSPKKACIMRNIDAVKKSKATGLVFEDLFRDADSSTTVIMTSLKNAPPAVIPKDALASISIVQFWKYFDRDLYNYLETSFKKLCIEYDTKALSLLIELNGSDIKKIDESIEMIKFSGITERLTEDIISNLITDVKDVNVFDFVDSLFKKEKKSLSILAKLFDEGAPELLILNRIMAQAEMIEKYHYLTSSGTHQEEALKECGVYYKKKDLFIFSAKKFQKDEMKKVKNSQTTRYSHLHQKCFSEQPQYDTSIDLVFFYTS